MRCSFEICGFKHGVYMSAVESVQLLLRGDILENKSLSVSEGVDRNDNERLAGGMISYCVRGTCN